MIYLDHTNINIVEIMKAGDVELGMLSDMALTDMVADINSPFKDPTEPRKVTIELNLTKFNDDTIAVDFKVTPKAAKYTKVPEEIKDAISDIQMSIFDELANADGEVKPS